MSDRKGYPLTPAHLCNGDIIVLPDHGRKAVVTDRESDSSCNYRTSDGKEGRIERCTPEAYDRRYGYVDPEAKTFTDNDIWYSKSIAIIETPNCCMMCPFSKNNGKGKAYCTLLWSKMCETGEYESITVYERRLGDLSMEKINEVFQYRDPRCPLIDLTPYQPKDKSKPIMDFVDGLEHEEFKLIRRSKRNDERSDC